MKNIIFLLILIFAQNAIAQNTYELPNMFFLEHINSEIKNYPDSVELYLLRMDYYLKNDNYNKLENQLKYISQTWPKNTDVFEYSGYAYIEMNNFRKAVDMYTKAILLNNQSYNCHIGLGYALKELGALDSALLYYNKAIELDYENPTAYLNKAEIFVLKNAPKKAINVYNNLLKVSPSNYDAYYGLGMAHYEDGSFQKAIKFLNEYYKVDSNQYVVKYLALSYYKTGDKDNACKFQKIGKQLGVSIPEISNICKE